MNSSQFQGIQLRIMQLLWARGKMSAREITEALNADVPSSKAELQALAQRIKTNKESLTADELLSTIQRSVPIAHSTTQTILRRLEARKAVAHQAEDRTFSFYPLVARDGVVRDFLVKLFAGSAAQLAAHLVEKERLSAAELAHLRKLIEEKGSPA